MNKQTNMRTMEIDKNEYAIILNALISMRNALRQEQKETDLVDKVIVKTVKAPSKKNRGIFKMKRKDSIDTR